MLCRFGRLGPARIVVLAWDYMGVHDDEYINDRGFGALIGPEPFRRVLERTLIEAVGVFHVHMHEHRGIPSPSQIDLRETAKFVPDLFHVRSDLPHGALILSKDSLSGRVWLGERMRPISITTVSVVGAPLTGWSTPA